MDLKKIQKTNNKHNPQLKYEPFSGQYICSFDLLSNKKKKNKLKCAHVMYKSMKFQSEPTMTANARKRTNMQENHFKRKNRGRKEGRDQTHIKISMSQNLNIQTCVC